MRDARARADAAAVSAAQHVEARATAAGDRARNAPVESAGASAKHAGTFGAAGTRSKWRSE